MNSYESFLKTICHETHRYLNEGGYHFLPKRESYRNASYYSQSEVRGMLNYIIQRWPESLKWCQEHNQESRAEEIFKKNMFDNRRQVFNHVLEILQLEDWKTLLEYDTREKQDELFNKYFTAFKQKIDDQISMIEAKKAEHAAQEQKEYEEWLKDNQWSLVREKMSFVDYCNRIDALERETNYKPLGKNSLINDLISKLYDERREMLEGIPIRDEGSMNSWYLYQPEKIQQHQDFIKSLEANNITRAITFSKELGHCYEQCTDVYCNQDGMPVYKVIYTVDSSD